MITLLLSCSLLASGLCRVASGYRSTEATAWKENPVGLVAKLARARGEGWVQFPIRVRDFRGASVLTSLMWNGEQDEYINAAVAFSDGESVFFMAFPPNVPGSMFSATLVPASASVALKPTPLPPVGGGLKSFVKTVSGFAYLSMGPVVTEFDAENHQLGRVLLDRGESVRSPTNEAMWAFDVRHRSFVVDCAGMATTKYGDLFKSRTYIGNMSGARKVVSGGVVGIVPPIGARDEWTIVRTDGRLESFALTNRKTYARVANRRPFRTHLYGDLGVYDISRKALYAETWDDRLAWISFENPRKPRIRYVSAPQPLIGTLTTFSESRWIADAIPENPSGPAHILWFEKLPSGAPTYRFTSTLKPGEAFLGLSDSRQQSRVR